MGREGKVLGREEVQFYSRVASVCRSSVHSARFSIHKPISSHQGFTYRLRQRDAAPLVVSPINASGSMWLVGCIPRPLLWLTTLSPLNSGRRKNGVHTGKPNVKLHYGQETVKALITRWCICGNMTGSSAGSKAFMNRISTLQHPPARSSAVIQEHCRPEDFVPLLDVCQIQVSSNGRGYATC